MDKQTAARLAKLVKLWRSPAPEFDDFRLRANAEHDAKVRRECADQLAREIGEAILDGAERWA